MASLNHAQVIGNTGSDPEIRYLGDSGNSKVATFSLATKERYKDRNGETQENTEWHSIVAFGRLADLAEKDIKKRWKEGTDVLMRELITVLEGMEDWGAEASEPVVLGWIKDHEYHMGNVMNAFRLTVVGECKGPHMFLITELLGKDETIARIKRGIDNIKPVEA